MSGAFATSASELARQHLAVIPLGGEDGKVPLIKFANWKRPPGQGFIGELAGKFPNANVGILCGLSNLTVVDIDDTTLTDTMIERCGDTPLKIATPSGGIHLVYRHNGERCSNLREVEGLQVDIKATGGLVVAPPSVRPTGEYAGKPYSFLAGAWDDIGSLPVVRSGSVPVQSKASNNTLNTIREGSRNTALFRALLKQVRHCDDFNALLDVAQSTNETFLPPLRDAEVLRTAASVWKKEQDGCNWVGGSPKVALSKAICIQLVHHPDAFALFCLLKTSHGARIEPFAICSKAMSRNEVIQGWGPKRFDKARRMLVQLGFLRMVHQGGNKRGDVSKFVFSGPDN
jgi:hypothetical protein